MQLEGPIHDCVCGLRYMRIVLDLDAIESERAHCTCGALLGEWNGKQRLVFDPEDAPWPTPLN